MENESSSSCSAESPGPASGEALIVDGHLTAAGPELLWRSATFVGITRGSTSEPPVLTQL
jgi:hypothetical protein